MKNDTATCASSANERTKSGGGIRCASDGRRLRVCLWGDVDAALRHQASAAMSQIVEHDGGVEIDVSRVSFIDSAGMAFIVQVHFLCVSAGREIVLTDPSPQIEELLDMIGLAGRIPTVHSKATRS